MARLSFRCSDELLKRVDEARGLAPRETWLRVEVVRAVERVLGVGAVVQSVEAAASEQALGSSGRAGVRGRVPALPPAEQPGDVEQALVDTEPRSRKLPAQGEPLGCSKVVVPAPAELPRVRSSAEARPFRPAPKQGKR